jgi:hypothetical protein
MQTPKRGNPRHAPKRNPIHAYRRPIEQEQQPAALARLTLHDTDPITGNYDQLFSLFYECYRGYTIYSTETGACCIHGAGSGGCLRIEGKYVVFLDIKEAKTLIKWFLAENQTAQESMNRQVSREAYRCLNRPRREEKRAIAS